MSLKKPIWIRAIAWMACWLLPYALMAQERTVNGRLFSKVDQTPVSGASVLIKGTTTGTSTGSDGKFSIQAKKGDVLVLSGVGFVLSEITLGDATDLKLEVDKDIKSMNEVVVTALGVRKETKRIGYAIQEVKGEDLVKARDQNPISGLTGKVAGLSVGPSAELLRKPTVLLRGNEITLYVVDGIPISSDTWNISPDDVDTYTVLKGPTAAALYGSRAQYGAILITTKKGNKARAKGFTVEFNSSNVVDKGFLAFPRVQYEYGPGENQLYAFGNGKGGGLNDNDYDVWGPRFDGQAIPQYDGKYDPNATFTTTYPGGYKYTGNIEPTPWVARGVNNLERFLQTGFQTTNNIALSAAGENYSMRFSLSHSYQQSIIPNNQLNITNFNMYGSYNITKNLKLDANFNFNRQYTPQFPDVDYGPNSLIYNIAVWTGADWNIDDMRNYWQPGKVGTQSIFAEYQRYHNPYFMVNEWLRGHYKNDNYGFVSLNYKFNEHLNLNARTQITGYDLMRTEKMPFSAHPYSREENLGDYREDHRNLFESNSDLQLNYNYTVKNFFNFSGLVGGSARLFKYNSLFTTTDYLNVPNVYSFSNSRNPVQANSFASDMRVYSAYYSLDLSFGKYATLSATGRVDQSSALPQGHNSYFYPSFSAASVLTDYINFPKFISFLKLRASYAAVHGDATSATVGVAPFTTITALGASTTTASGTSLYDYPLDYGNNYLSPYNGPDYSLVAVYSTNKPYNNQTAATYTSNLYDPNIKTFNRVNYEAGVDIKFLENRLGFSATGFQYIDGPRILKNDISTSTGYTGYYINALKTKKTGWELSLQGSPIRSRDFKWDVLVNWSTFQDKYDELPPGQDTYNTFFKKGDRVDKLYTSAFARSPDGQIINDAAGKPINNPVAQYMGNLNADFAWSIYNKVNYKGISLGFQFDGSVGGVTSDYMHNKTMRGGRNIETVEGAFGVSRGDDNDHAGDATYPGTYVGEGVVVTNNVPIDFDSKTGEILNYKQLQFGPNTTPTHVQDYISKYYGIDESNLMSKTFAKLREITIGYDFPSSWLDKTFINKVSVSFVARNLIYFYKDKRFKDVDLDQYNYSTSGTGLQSPTTRRYGFNFNIVF